MGGQGSLVLGVVGPAGTIAAGHVSGLPGWAILVIGALQIAGAVVTRRWH